MSELPTCSALTDDVRHALEVLVGIVERHSQEFRASVLLVSDDGKHLVDAAAPRLPDAYRAAIDGLAIGPVAGSCGTAAHRGTRVIVADTYADPLWAPFREIAQKYGLRACWSEPITAPDGTVLGTFAMYYSECRSPDRGDLEVIQAAARRASLILEGSRDGARSGALLQDGE